MIEYSIYQDGAPNRPCNVCHVYAKFRRLEDGEEIYECDCGAQYYTVPEVTN